jgi:magnesium transporter
MLDPKIRLTLESVKRLSRRGAKTNLRNLINKTHPADLAVLFRHVDDRLQQEFFLLVMESQGAGEFLSELDPIEYASQLEPMGKDRIADILRDLQPDDVALIIRHLEEELGQAVLSALQVDESAEVEALLEYGEDTAGGIMTPSYLALEENVTAKEAIEILQNSGDIEMVFYLYAVDEHGHLVGALSLRHLVTHAPSTRLRDIMTSDVIRVETSTDQEEVARMVGRYDLLAIPVVDDTNKLVGIVTVDDVIDVLREETTEDMLKIAGTDYQEITNRSVLTSYKVRLPWLFASLVGGVLAAYIMGFFKMALQNVVVLSMFIPVILGMGGNLGTQSMSIAVRGIATGKIDVRRTWRFTFKELRVAMLLGITYGLLLAIVAHFYFSGGLNLGIVVGLGICFSMCLAAVIGSMVPLMLHRMGIDPAVATGPFVTTAIDILGITGYLLIARSLLL